MKQQGYQEGKELLQDAAIIGNLDEGQPSGMKTILPGEVVQRIRVKRTRQQAKVVYAVLCEKSRQGSKIC